MNHSHRVHAPEGLGQTGGQSTEGREAKRAMVGDGPVERRAAHIAGDDVWRIAVDVGVENLRDSWPAHPGQRRDLPAEPGPAVVSADQPGSQRLDGDQLAAGRYREVYDAHTALADPFDEAVRTEPLWLGGRGVHQTTVPARLGRARGQAAFALFQIGK